MSVHRADIRTYVWRPSVPHPDSGPEVLHTREESQRNEVHTQNQGAPESVSRAYVKLLLGYKRSYLIDAELVQAVHC
jgi:hypothetical protein